MSKLKLDKNDSNHHDG